MSKAATITDHLSSVWTLWLIREGLPVMDAEEMQDRHALAKNHPDYISLTKRQVHWLNAFEELWDEEMWTFYRKVPSELAA